ncbi:DUF4350 domain-containing protein [Pseudoalteromonas sp. SMS1]|uniref:DUF4350 domain-containing protein n=1 Tax=Pseudoalteromonas sp. SMS1 TaxID=2908894 RepID=UPI001F40BB22|nr:DUF4350 domain-containing protein [Pseudoalteromonas sp. SMS1]MCF2859120.1 DUF4350 domain-containing protein [Pseudoalteromonas sp. SMS1]
MRLLKFSFFGGLLIFLIACSDSNQLADPNFIPQNTHKTFSDNNSPVVSIDEAHNNFLTANGRYRPFKQVLESAGYTVWRNKRRFSLDSLRPVDIIVIANALDRKRKDWRPPYTDALTTSEVSSIKTWVSEGGSLFLIADHTPFPRIIENLAVEFGFEFSNGHVGNALFHIKDKTLGAHAITTGVEHGKNKLLLPAMLTEVATSTPRSNRIAQIKTFGGAAFIGPPESVSLLTLGDGAFSTVPEVPFQVNSDTPRLSVRGWSQGAVLEVGKGRVAVFSEGMMFSSQLNTNTGKPMGFTSHGAEQNEAFLLNVMAWLAGVI